VEREQLSAWLDAGLSLIQISVVTGRHPSTVGYWVQKYGLVANGRDRYAPRGGLSREKLEAAIERGATQQEIADEFGCNLSTARRWLARYGLKTKHQGGRPPAASPRDVEAALANGSRTVIGQCPRHGSTQFAIHKSGRLRCKRCASDAVARRRRRVKETLVAEAGGSCLICGYNRCIQALGFHHRDPQRKEFGIALRGVTRAIDAVRDEAKKCVLLCANCHAEVEAGVVELPLES
jgi:transposase-like protein